MLEVVCLQKTRLSSRGERLLSERSIKDSLAFCNWSQNSSAAFASDDRQRCWDELSRGWSPEDGEFAEARLKAIKRSLEDVNDTKWPMRTPCWRKNRG